MYHRPPSRRASTAPTSQHGYRPREWAGQSLGAILAAYRETYGKSVEDVAQDLCIRRAHVRALEDEQYSNLPELSYSAGFVRSYAKYLGLPPEEMVSRFRETYRQLDRNAPKGRQDANLLSVATVPYSPRWPSFAVLAIAAVLLGSSYMVMAAYTAATNTLSVSEDADPSVELIQAAPLAPVIHEYAPEDDVVISFEIETADVESAAAGQAQSQAANDSTGSTGFIETVDVTAPVDQIVVYGIAVPQARPVVINQTPQTLESVNQFHRVVIAATGRAYITLADQHDGVPFLRSEYQRGDKYLVPDDKTVRLMSQNLDRLEIIIDGQAYRVAPAIAALNEPLILNPDVLPGSSQLIRIDDLDL